MLDRHLLPNMRPIIDTYFSLNGEGEGGGGSGGGNGGEGGGGTGGAPEPKNDPEPKDEKTFTQADLDRAASARANEAKRKAERDLADSLGVSIEEAKRILKEHADKADLEKSEAQRSKEAADKAKAEADQAKADAAKERMSAKVERALIRSHVRDDRVDQSLLLVTVAPDATDEEIAAAVATFKGTTPEFFSEDEGGNGGGTGGKPAVPGDPKGKPAPKRTEDGYTRGVERAKKQTGGGDGTYPILQQVK